MIRFLPDTWRDALLRPLAMAAPDAWVYVEIMAPDFRFLAILGLLAVLGAYALARRRRPGTAVLVLTAFVALLFVPWMATTGNGRYFIAVLLLAGPLCVGLAWKLPATRGLRFTVAAGLVALQGFALSLTDPFGWWSLAKWGAPPFFELEIPPEVAAQPATFVTLSSISYSLIAPRFHPDSRWMNLSAVPANPAAPDARRARALMAGSPKLLLLFPSLGTEFGFSSAQLDASLREGIDGMVARFGVAIADPATCRFLRSKSLGSVGSRGVDTSQSGEHGFWLCGSRRVPEPAVPAGPVEGAAAAQPVYDKLESLCPRLFRPGESATYPIPSGVLRMYPSSDTKLYVLRDGDVMYKYLRALNPVKVGTVAQVLAPGYTMDCDRVRGRSGLPWERGL